jgi:hypothetical protein
VHEPDLREALTVTGRRSAPPDRTIEPRRTVTTHLDPCHPLPVMSCRSHVADLRDLRQRSGARGLRPGRYRALAGLLAFGVAACSRPERVEVPVVATARLEPSLIATAQLDYGFEILPENVRDLAAAEALARGHLERELAGKGAHATTPREQAIEARIRSRSAELQQITQRLSEEMIAGWMTEELLGARSHRRFHAAPPAARPYSAQTHAVNRRFRSTVAVQACRVL